MGWILFASLTTIVNITPQGRICREYSNIRHAPSATQIKKEEESDKDMNIS